MQWESIKTLSWILPLPTTCITSNLYSTFSISCSVFLFFIFSISFFSYSLSLSFSSLLSVFAVAVAIRHYINKWTYTFKHWTIERFIFAKIQKLILLSYSLDIWPKFVNCFNRAQKQMNRKEKIANQEFIFIYM